MAYATGEVLVMAKVTPQQGSQGGLGNC